MSYEYNSSHDMSMHISTIENMASHLRDIGVTIDDQMIVAKITDSLPSPYDPFVLAWESVSDTDQTISHLTARLTAHEMRIGKSIDKKESAFYAPNLSGADNNRHHPLSNQSGPSFSGHGNNNNSQFRGKWRKRWCTHCRNSTHDTDFCRHLKKKSKANHSQAKVAQDVLQDFSFVASRIPFSDRGKLHFFADSGCSQHMTDQRHIFSHFQPVDPNTWFVEGIGESHLSVKGKGTVPIVSYVGNETFSMELKEVLYVPDLGANLISVRAFTARGGKVLFEGGTSSFYFKEKLCIEGHCGDKSKLYSLNIMASLQLESKEDFAMISFPRDFSAAAWHERLGHTCYNNLRTLANGDFVTGFKVTGSIVKPNCPCIGCMAGKMCRDPFSGERPREEEVGGRIHSDVAGPMQVETPNKARYLCTFIDDCSGFRATYFLKKKSDVFEAFKLFKAKLESETGKKIRALRTDGGKEYDSTEFQQFLTADGIRHETTPAHTPQLNGVAERANRSIIEAVRCALHMKKLDLSLWAEAANWAVDVQNCLPTTVCKTTPYEVWHKKKPDVSRFYKFGSPAWMHIPKADRRKLDSKSLPCLYVGHADTGFRLFDPVSRKVLKSRDVVIYEEPTSNAAHCSKSEMLQILLDPDNDLTNSPGPTQVAESVPIVLDNPVEILSTDSSQDVGSPFSKQNIHHDDALSMLEVLNILFPIFI